MASDGWALVLFRVCPQNIGDGGHDLRPQPYLSPGLVCRCLVHDQPETWGQRDLRHTVRAFSRSGPPFPHRRALHQRRGHPAVDRTGPDAPAGTALGHCATADSGGAGDRARRRGRPQQPSGAPSHGSSVAKTSCRLDRRIDLGPRQGCPPRRTPPLAVDEA